MVAPKWVLVKQRGGQRDFQRHVEKPRLLQGGRSGEYNTLPTHQRQVERQGSCDNALRTILGMNHAAYQSANTPTSLPTVTPYQRVTWAEETAAEVNHSARGDSQKNHVP